MSHKLFYLRAHRKRSRLTQADVAFLLDLPEHTSVSHWESGRRFPSLEIIILYHLLFEIPHDTLFHERKEEFLHRTVERIKELLNMLQSIPSDQHVRSRITFLENVLTRLVPSNNHE